jgi:DNA-binding response OmpR family regulator
MKVCKTLRDETDPGLRDIPILILTGLKLTEADLIDAFVEGATDYLTKPIKPTMVRSRVRGWLLRTTSP